MFPRACALTLLLMLCSGCPGLGDSVDIAIHGVPALPPLEAAEKQPTAFTLVGGRIDLRHLGYAFTSHHRLGESHRFLATVQTDAGEPTGLFVGCRSSAAKEATRDRCIERLGKRPLTVQRDNIGLYREAQKRFSAEGTKITAVYELADDPRGDAVADLVPIPIALIALAGAIGSRRIRARILRWAGAER